MKYDTRMLYQGFCDILFYKNRFDIKLGRKTQGANSFKLDQNRFIRLWSSQSLKQCIMRQLQSCLLQRLMSNMRLNFCTVARKSMGFCSLRLNLRPMKQLSQKVQSILSVSRVSSLEKGRGYILNSSSYSRKSLKSISHKSFIFLSTQLCHFKFSSGV